MPQISVVIPTLGRPEKLARVLAELRRQTVGADAFEVLVVGDPDERHPEAVRAAVAESGLAASHLARERPGVSAARNLGWQRASAELVLFLDDDVLPAPQLLAEHLASHRENPGEEVGVLGHVGWASELTVTPFMRWLEAGIQFDYFGIDGEEAGWGRLYTANASLKRSLIARAGGFDEENFPFGYEDIDLGYRLNGLGLRLLYNEAAAAEHLQTMDLAQWRGKICRIAVAERRFHQLHPEIPAYFHELFSQALAGPPARGRATRLARWIPPGLPIVGQRTWSAADLYWRQQLGEVFMQGWKGAS